MAIDREFQVLIVGGGLAGLGTARLLRTAGLDPVVVERDDEIEAGGPVELWPDATAALSWLGIEDAVREAGTVIDVWERRDADGCVAARLAAPDGGLLAVEYGDLRAVLRASLPPGAVRTATTVSRLEDARRGVTVEFDNGVVERFDAVVGADGVDSTVRRGVGGPPPEFLGTTSCAFRLGPGAGPDGAVERWTADGTVLGLLPTGDGTWGCLTAPADAPTEPRAARELVLDHVSGIDWLDADALPDGPDGFVVRNDHRVPAGPLAERRVALLGDAARARHRLAGLGPTLALEDAAALTAALTEIDGPLPARLAAYACRRRSRAPPDGGGDAVSLPLLLGPRAPDAVAAAAGPRSARLSASFAGTDPSPTVASPLRNP